MKQLCLKEMLIHVCLLRTPSFRNPLHQIWADSHLGAKIYRIRLHEVLLLVARDLRLLAAQDLLRLAVEGSIKTKKVVSFFLIDSRAFLLIRAERFLDVSPIWKNLLISCSSRIESGVIVAPTDSGVSVKGTSQCVRQVAGLVSPSLLCDRSTCL